LDRPAGGKSGGRVGVVGVDRVPAFVRPFLLPIPSGAGAAALVLFRTVASAPARRHRCRSMSSFSSIISAPPAPPRRPMPIASGPPLQTAVEFRMSVGPRCASGASDVGRLAADPNDATGKPTCAIQIGISNPRPRECRMSAPRRGYGQGRHSGPRHPSGRRARLGAIDVPIRYAVVFETASRRRTITPKFERNRGDGPRREGTPNVLFSHRGRRPSSFPMPKAAEIDLLRRLYRLRSGGRPADGSPQEARAAPGQAEAPK